MNERKREQEIERKKWREKERERHGREKEKRTHKWSMQISKRKGNTRRCVSLTENASTRLHDMRGDASLCATNLPIKKNRGKKNPTKKKRERQRERGRETQREKKRRKDHTNGERKRAKQTKIRVDAYF